MFYKDVEALSDVKFKRLTGVKRAVFELMLEVVAASRAATRKHPTRGTPPQAKQCRQAADAADVLPGIPDNVPYRSDLWRLREPCM